MNRKDAYLHYKRFLTELLWSTAGVSLSLTHIWIILIFEAVTRGSQLVRSSIESGILLPFIVAIVGTTYIRSLERYVFEAENRPTLFFLFSSIVVLVCIFLAVVVYILVAIPEVQIEITIKKNVVTSGSIWASAFAAFYHIVTWFIIDRFNGRV